MRFARTTFANISVSVSFVSEVTRQDAFLKYSHSLLGLILKISLRKKQHRLQTRDRKRNLRKPQV